MKKITERFSRLPNLDSRFGVVVFTQNIVSGNFFTPNISSNTSLRKILFLEISKTQNVKKIYCLNKIFSSDESKLYRKLKNCRMLIRKRIQTEFP